MTAKKEHAQDQAARLAELIQEIVFLFGIHGLDGECCGDLSHAEVRALRSALHRVNCTMQEVAKNAVVTKSGATRIVARLEDKGLVSRQHNPKDGRICCVTLTKEGRALLVRIEEQLKADMRSILETMDPAMRDILLVSLNTFLNSAKLNSPQGGSGQTGSLLKDDSC